jgi:RNA polymerase sigma-70 factor (ECF subfamily)
LAERSVEPDPDRALVRDLASDDAAVRRRALADLYARHQTRVFNVAYRVLGSHADAQDVAQDVFLHVADRIRSFRGDASLTSWVYRVTVNLSIDRRRREARRAVPRAMGESDGEGEVGSPRPGVAGAPPDPASEAQRAEGERRVRAALERLSPKLRAVVVLRYFENLSYEELAEVLQMSIGTVKSRLNRAHAALERILAPYAGEASR